MEADSRTNDNLENQHPPKFGRRIFNASNVFQSFWIRRTICANDETNGIIFGGRHYFLLHFNIILYLILCIFKKGKI